MEVRMVNTPSADSDNEPVACFVAIELSKSAWVSGFQTPLSDKTSRHQVKAGDAQALLQPTPIAPEERALVSALPPEDRPETGPVKPLPPQFRRATIEYRTRNPQGPLSSILLTRISNSCSGMARRCVMALALAARALLGTG
jgi:hypothetical protein